MQKYLPRRVSKAKKLTVVQEVLTAASIVMVAQREAPEANHLILQAVAAIAALAMNGFQQSQCE